MRTEYVNTAHPAQIAYLFLAKRPLTMDAGRHFYAMLPALAYDKPRLSLH